MLTSRPTVLGQDEVNRCVEAIRQGAVRPSAATLPSSDARHSKPQRAVTKRRRGRPVAALVGAAVLLAAVLGGGLAKAGDWVGEQMVEVIAPSEPVEPTPSRPAKQRKQKQQKDKQRDGQQEQRTG